MANYWEMDQRRPEHTAASVGNLAGFTTSGTAGTAVRQPVGGELVENRLTSLLGGNSQYIQNARARGAKQAASRGLLNSSLASAASEASAINSALPIAAQDAAAFTQANTQNQSDLNAANLLKMKLDQDRQSTTVIGGNSYNALDSQIDHDRRLELMREQSRLDREGAREDRDWRSGESRADRDWRSGESGLDRGMTREGWQFQSDESRRGRDWQSGENERDRGFQRERDDFRMQWESHMFDRESARRDREMWYSMFGGAFGNAFQTVMSDPAYFRDPAAAFGFMEGWGSQLTRLFSRFGIGGMGNRPNGP